MVGSLLRIPTTPAIALGVCPIRAVVGRMRKAVTPDPSESRSTERTMDASQGPMQTWEVSTGQGTDEAYSCSLDMGSQAQDPSLAFS
jgi:hypothetical protein